ncbi:MAG: carboxymuconolactone decarboxylase family protein [Rubrivivax sp.]
MAAVLRTRPGGLDREIHGDGELTPRSRELDAKTIEFIAIAVDASHLYAPGVRRHIRRALLELGATKEEIVAGLQCVSVLGIHSMSLGADPALELAAAATPCNPRQPTLTPDPDP